MLTKEIVKRGDSNYILIPKSLLNMLNLQRGDEVSLLIEDNRIVISPVKKDEGK